ncbi:MAG TPA: FHA domain-containing protein [Nocardioides sp.]|nr:FHA domain-containing protein [Nocardioides sp.]
MSTEARFAAGDWYAVVGDRVTVLLPASQRDRVAALWDLADSGADPDAVLDALLAGGLSSLDHFALVSHDDDATRLILRGAPSASVSTIAGDETVTATPGTTWAERLVTGATSIRLTLTGDGAAEHLLTPGLSRVSVVELGTPQASPEAVPAAPLTFGEPEDDPTPTGEAPVVADDWPDRDGQTVSGPPAADFERPPIPGQEMAPAVVSRPVASLVFSTGDVVGVDRTVLVGRAPEARRFASHDQPHVVTVPSPHQEISSTHLEIRPGAGADHGSAIATDLGSTNGTVLAQPGLDAEELTPGIAVSLVPGAVLDLGDGVTIQVTNP